MKMSQRCLAVAPEILEGVQLTRREVAAPSIGEARDHMVQLRWAGQSSWVEEYYRPAKAAELCSWAFRAA